MSAFVSGNFPDLVQTWPLQTRLLSFNYWTDREGWGCQLGLPLPLKKEGSCDPRCTEGMPWDGVHQCPVEYIRHQVTNQLQRLLTIWWGIAVCSWIPTRMIHNWCDMDPKATKVTKQNNYCQYAKAVKLKYHDDKDNIQKTKQTQAAILQTMERTMLNIHIIIKTLMAALTWFR